MSIFYYRDDGDLMLPWAYTAAAVTLFAIGFFGFFLNLFVIALMCKDVQLWTPINIIMFNLICSDFSVSIIGNPLTLASALSHRWMFGRTMCIAYGFFMSLLGISSITTLMVLSYERYYLVSFPFASKTSSTKRALLAILFIWLYAFLLTMPPLIGWGEYVNEAADISCSVNWESQTFNATSYIVFLFIFGLVVPLFVITYSYVNIIVTMRRNANRLGRVNKAEQRITVMIALMIVAFMFAWTPYSIFALIEQFGSPDTITPAMAILPALVAKSSICYNPIIYVGMNTQYRAAFKRLLHKKNDLKPGHELATNNITISSGQFTIDCIDIRQKRKKSKIKGKGKVKQLPPKKKSLDTSDQTSSGNNNSEDGQHSGRNNFELSVISTGQAVLVKADEYKSNV